MPIKLQPISNLHRQPTKPQREDEATKLQKRFYPFVTWLERERGAGRVSESLIVLPMPANAANIHVHWRERQACKTVYHDQVVFLSLRRLLPTPISPVPTQVVVTARLVVKKQMDDDNALARCKYPLDELKHLGYMVDDSREHCRWGAVPDQFVDRCSPQRIEFRLEPAEK